MKRNKLKKSSTHRSLVLAIVTGIAVATFISVMLILLLANFVLNGSLREGVGSVSIFLIRAFSVLAGSIVSAMLFREGKLPIVGLISVGYLFVLLGTGIVFFDKSFQNFLSAVASILLGGIAALLILQRSKGKCRKLIKYNL